MKVCKIFPATRCPKVPGDIESANLDMSIHDIGHLVGYHIFEIFLCRFDGSKRKDWNSIP